MILKAGKASGNYKMMLKKAEAIQAALSVSMITLMRVFCDKHPVVTIFMMFVL